MTSTADLSAKERYGGWVLVAGASAGLGAAFAFESARLGFDVVLQHPKDRSRQRSQGQKRLKKPLRLSGCPALFVGTANDAEITEIALSLVRRRGKK